jgi:hypothetical protein
LGVTDHRYLGGPLDGGQRDDGHGGNADPRAFWQLGTDPAAFETAVQALADSSARCGPRSS